MEKDNCELLFEYLKSILYDSKIQKLDLEKLDEPYQKLGKGLQFLQKAVEEMLTYSAELSKGNLSCQYPSRDNFLCVNLKNLHANLNHLTWQAKQVASGDYSQNVSYLGEFSDAFNTMTAQLKERETLLKEEAAIAKRRAEVIEGYNELWVELTIKRNEWILVVDADSREILYCNKRKGSERRDPSFCQICTDRLSFRNALLNWQDGSRERMWEMGNEEQGFYRVTTFDVEWRGHRSYAHIVLDITEDKQTAQKLTSKAYFDPGTGIRNRLFFEEHMEKLLSGKENIILCYIDLDGLKYVNDTFGHPEGDCYIRSFVTIIRNSFREEDVFARIGGDEFCLILTDNKKSAAETRFSELLERFVAENNREYPVSFSYGIIEIEGKNNQLGLEEIIKLADSEMYECKRRNREKYHALPR